VSVPVPLAGDHLHLLQPGPVVAAISETTIGAKTAGYVTQRNTATWKASRIVAMCGCGFAVVLDVAALGGAGDG